MFVLYFLKTKLCPIARIMLRFKKNQLKNDKNKMYLLRCSVRISIFNSMIRFDLCSFCRLMHT